MVKFIIRNRLAYNPKAQNLKLRVGDRVKVLNFKSVSQVKEHDWDFPGHFNDSMEAYCGKVGTITAANPSAYYDKCLYRIDIDGGRWNWTVHMFEIGGSKLMENE